MGGRKVRNYPSLLKWHPEAGDLQKDIIFDHRFYTVAHLGQINFDPFWGTLGVKKGQKLPIFLKVTSRSCKFA